MTERTLTAQEAEALVKRARERVAAKKQAKELKATEQANKILLRQLRNWAKGDETNEYGETAFRVKVRWALYIIGAPIAFPALLVKALVSMRWV